MSRHSSFIRAWMAYGLRRFRALWTGQYWTLEISHRYGNDVSLYISHEDAYQALVRYVDDFWSSQFDDTDPRPSDDQAAVDAYFEEGGLEWYSITRVHLGGPTLITGAVAA